MAVELTIHHLGRLTQAIVPGGTAQLKSLRNALLLKNFVICAESENGLELRRRAYLLQDDWPMRVIVRRDGDRFDIRYFLFIPWGWIIALIFLSLIVLPFAGIPRAELALGLAAIVATLAIYKQKFDCRPNAKYWQQKTRQRWHQIMEQLIREAFVRR
ncbi:MAG: hypothetical protein IPP10_12275 [Candidatus Competibacteraceae bacterium]|nr:hypothetical protein [Candidatus Competibacteraceae bacterium]MBK8899270.1 hypothetical protein [Candidatus Competibacteraceae bacterium]MBK8963308.1 hypothetical protein [Candidatus Competibacteraceae bacterium]MBK9952269.1 hypothetical protein [Candidatus Competibacteraceae bacterium]